MCAMTSPRSWQILTKHAMSDHDVVILTTRRADDSTFPDMKDILKGRIDPQLTFFIRASVGLDKLQEAKKRARAAGISCVCRAASQ